MKQSRGLSGNLKPVQKKHTNWTTKSLATDNKNQMPTFWNRLRKQLSLSLGQTRCLTNKEGSKYYQT